MLKKVLRMKFAELCGHIALKYQLKAKKAFEDHMIDTKRFQRADFKSHMWISRAYYFRNPETYGRELYNGFKRVYED